MPDGQKRAPILSLDLGEIDGFHAGHPLHCFSINSHLVGAVLACLSIITSSGVAYFLGHIGKNISPDIIAANRTVQGCRFRLVQDISCGGVFFPEYYIFGGGLTGTSIILCIAVCRCGYVLQHRASRRQANLFLLFGISGCVSCIGMAWISMRYWRTMHLFLAINTFGGWMVAFTIRAFSGIPPYVTMSRFTVAAAIICSVVWLCGIWFHVSLSIAEWLASGFLLSHAFTLPVLRPDPSRRLSAIDMAMSFSSCFSTIGPFRGAESRQLSCASNATRQLSCVTVPEEQQC